MTITYGDKAPASAKAEYTTDGETWMQFGSDVKPAAGQTVTFKADKGTVNATKVRIVNTVNNDYMNATEIQAFVTPVQGAAKNIAAASGTNFSVPPLPRPSMVTLRQRVGPLGLPPPRRWTRSPRSPSTKLRPSPK